MSAAGTEASISIRVRSTMPISLESTAALSPTCIARINPAAAAGSRSLLVYIEVANQEGLLKGGMFAKGGLTLDARAAVLAVPIAALREEAGQPVVYRVEAGKLVRSAVKTGVRNEEEGWVEITAGLAAGAQVVKANLGELKVDVPVTVVQK